MEYDPYISDALEIIKDSVIEKIITQFLGPYKQIKISEIANILGLQVSSCQNILMKMIKHKQVPFLIDSINQVK